jgi:hypothetical protein
MHALVLVTGLLGTAVVPSGNEKVPMPTGPPPLIQVVSAVDADKGTVTFHRVVVVHVPIQVQELVNVNGNNFTVTKTSFRDELRTEQFVLVLKDAKIQTAAGKDVTAADALKQLKTGSGVLVSADGKAVDRAYLGVVSAETLVLVPPPPTPSPAGPVILPPLKELPPPAPPGGGK